MECNSSECTYQSVVHQELLQKVVYQEDHEDEKKEKEIYFINSRPTEHGLVLSYHHLGPVLYYYFIITINFLDLILLSVPSPPAELNKYYKIQVFTTPGLLSLFNWAEIFPHHLVIYCPVPDIQAIQFILHILKHLYNSVYINF